MRRRPNVEDSQGRTALFHAAEHGMLRSILELKDRKVRETVRFDHRDCEGYTAAIVAAANAVSYTHLTLPTILLV